ASGGEQDTDPDRQLPVPGGADPATRPGQQTAPSFATPTPSQRAMLGQPTRVGAEAPLAESQLRAVRRGPGAYLVLGAVLLAAGGVGGYLVMGNKKSSDVTVPEPEEKPVPAVPVAVEP